VVARTPPAINKKIRRPRWFSFGVGTLPFFTRFTQMVSTGTLFPRSYEKASDPPSAGSVTHRKGDRTGRKFTQPALK
jgi:hypothetical protein